MKCTAFSRVGYNGQRYEVRALRPPMGSPMGESAEPFVVGWTDSADGGALVKMVERHPSWRGARVVDLGADQFKRVPTPEGARPQ